MFTKVKWYQVLGVLLLPLMFVGGFLAATWNMSDRLQTVEAAIVNNDEAVTVNGRLVPLGRQLTAALVDSNREQNFEWVMANSDDAAAGLKSGRYAAVVTIPQNFSKTATSMGGDATQAEKAVINIETTPNGGIAETVLGQSVAREAIASLNSTLTKNYLDQIYIGFNTMAAQFMDLKTATRELATGASSLSGGVDQAAQGSRDLSDGAGRLAQTGGRLTSGADGLASGAKRLASGLEQMRSQTSGLPGQTQRLAAGTNQYVAGVNQLITQTEKSSSMLSGLGQVSQLTTGAQQLSGGLQQYAAGLHKAATSPVQLPTDPSQLPPCPQQIALGLGPAGCQAYYAGLAAGAQMGVQQTARQALAGLQDRPDGTPGVLTGARQLSSGMTRFQQAIDQLPQPDPKAAQQLQALRKAGSQLQSGTQQLAGGMPKLTSGISQAATGARQLASGADQFASGLRTYTGGVDSLSLGAQRLNGGMNQLSTGASQLSAGAEKLATGVEKGASEIPTYSESERKQLSEVVAAPVSDENANGLVTPDVPWVSLLLVLALWLGAMAMYIVTRPVRPELALSRMSTPALLLQSAAPGVGIAVGQAALTAFVAWAFGVPAGVGVCGVLLLASLAFVAVNYALTGLFGNVGRGLAAAFAVITAAAAMTYALPGVFDWLRPLSPVSPALAGVRAVMTGTSALPSVLALAGWLVVGLVGSVIVVIRSRQVPLSAVVPQG